MENVSNLIYRLKPIQKLQKTEWEILGEKKIKEIIEKMFRYENHIFVSKGYTQ